MSNKKNIKNIDLIRVFACFAVLFYHLNLLKGGYLAVCTFFVLSGYFSCISAFKKERFSILNYYRDRFLKIYLPLLIVIFITLFGISFCSITWINLKPETTSVLFGYNNFWQLQANLDYFTRQVNSPFTHFWYLSILLQFELFFPFLYLFFRKLGDKIHRICPCILSLTLSILFSLFFYQASLQENLMFAYYHTFSRIFSLLFGISLGFIHSYYGSILGTKFKKKKISRFLFPIFLLVLFLFFLVIDSSSKFFAFSMIIVTLISCQLIDFSIWNQNEETNFFDKSIAFFSHISYEIYLVQYPIIFLFQNLEMPFFLKIICILISILLVSLLLHFSFYYKKEKYQISRYSILLIFIITSLYGLLYFVLSKDYTQEMKKLEEQLSQNEIVLKTKQDEYLFRMQAEEKKWQESLQNYDLTEEQIKEMVQNLNIVGIGDSVMLGAINQLYQTFSNGYFDAKVSRTAWVVKDILKDLKSKNMLGNPILLNLGANGDCSDSFKQEIMKECEEREVFWVNVTNDHNTHVNASLEQFASQYENLHIIDWNSYSKDYKEYFVADGIHLTEIGKKAYTQFILESIYQTYLQKMKQEKDRLLNQYIEEQKTKITFIGNDVLLNAFSVIQNHYPQASFLIDQNYTFSTLKERIIDSKNSNMLSYNLIFLFDRKLNITIQEYQELINLCSDHNIYFFDMDGKLNNLNNLNVSVIPFSLELQNHSNYLMVDQIHLTEEGNLALLEKIKEKIDFLNRY